jgi:hypothetical protein
MGTHKYPKKRKWGQAGAGGWYGISRMVGASRNDVLMYIVVGNGDCSKKSMGIKKRKWGGRGRGMVWNIQDGGSI